MTNNESLTYNVSPKFSHIKPTHMVKILSSDYNVIKHVNTIGSKMPAIKSDNGIGYDVLCDDGNYRYMSLMYKEIEVVGEFINGKIK